MNASVAGFVFARGGSKGVPRKNVRLLGGKPLIAYSIEAARMSRLIDRVIVSTDDAEIAAVAREYGAEVPFMRPAELARDDSPEWLAWQHALSMIEKDESATRLDAFVCIPPTSPLRAVEDIDACIEKLLGTDADIVITVKHAERSPFFNMVVMNDAGEAQLVIRPEKQISRRQDAPAVYDVTTVAYAARPQFVRESSSIFEGKVRAVVVPAERALDIDTELDFKFAEFLIKESR